MAKTIVSHRAGDGKMIITEHCDHGEPVSWSEGWVRVDLGGHRHIYLCPHCAGLMRWEAIKALVGGAALSTAVSLR